MNWKEQLQQEEWFVALEPLGDAQSRAEESIQSLLDTQKEEVIKMIEEEVQKEMNRTDDWVDKVTLEALSSLKDKITKGL